MRCIISKEQIQPTYCLIFTIFDSWAAITCYLWCMITIDSFGITQIAETARQVVEACEWTSVWLFEGPMGAGKTTLIKAICHELGVQNNVQSPTFSIVNEYITQNGRVIYHFDCYRLKSQVEALDIGLEEYLDSGQLCLIEWPNKIESLLPKGCAKIQITALANQQRRIEMMNLV